MQGQGGRGGASPAGHHPCPQAWSPEPTRDQDHPQGRAGGTQSLEWLPVSVAHGR